MLYSKKWDFPKIKIEPWQKILLAAADILRKNGHCKGRTVNQKGEHCLMGAISAKTTIDPDMENWPEYRQAIRALQATIGRTEITVWNDRPSTTKEAAIAMLIKAAR